MSAKKNKVKFNICNVHYALITVDEDGEVTFGTPVAMPGAVSLSLEPNGEPSNFYADGYAYYTISNNMGYEGDLELAMVPESFRTDVLKESLDDNSVLVESANVETANFSLLFEFPRLINGYKVTLESKVMIVGIFVLLQIVFIQKMPMSKLSIIAI